MNNPPVETEIIIPGSETAIKAVSQTLSFKGQATFDIVVDAHEQDDISIGIRNQSYGFPLAFDLLPALAHVGERVLDLGAHIGTFSLLAAKLGYDVAAVEASPHNATLLQESAKRNHFDHLHLIAAAVSDRKETLNFIQAGPYGLVATPFHTDPTIQVQAMSVDEILAQLGWERVAFIKMDVEGSEVKAIAGMNGLLSPPDAPTILYESNGHTLHYFGQTPNTLMAALEAIGYQCYLIQHGQLIPLYSGEPLFICTVDCLATKMPPNSLPGWRLRTPLTSDERISHILNMANQEHPYTRVYIARTLQGAGIELIADYRVFKTLESLATDADPEVRANATWFQSEDFQRLPSAKRKGLSPSLALLPRAKGTLRHLWNKFSKP